MKKTILFLILATVSTAAIAQPQVVFSNSPEKKLVSNKTYEGIVAENNEFFYVLEDEGTTYTDKKPTLFKYRKSDVSLASSTLLNVDGKKNESTRFYKVLSLADGMFYIQTKIGTNEIYFIGQKVNADGVADSKVVYLDTLKCTATAKEEYYHLNTIVDVELAPNKQKFTLVRRKSSGDQLNFVAKVFSSSISLMEMRSFTIKSEQSFSLLSSLTFTNAGELYFMLKKGTQPERTIDRVYTSCNYTEEKYFVGKLGSKNSFVEAPLAAESKYFADAKLIIDEAKSRVIVGAIYSKSNVGANGAVLFTFDMNLKSTSTSAKEFQPNYVANTFSAYTSMSNEMENRVAVKNIVVKEDGNIIVLAEVYNLFNYTMGNSSSNYLHEYFQDIIVFQAKPTGEVTWISKVPKQQYAANFGASHAASYLAIVANNELYITYIDDKKNFNLAAGKKRTLLNNPGKAFSFLAKVSGDGKVTITKLMSEDNIDNLVKPIESMANQQEKVIYFQSVKAISYRYGKVTF